MKWKLNFDVIPTIGEAESLQYIRQAFDDWARYTPLTFHEVSANETADINIAFSAGNHEEGWSFDRLTLAHVFLPTDGRIYFDATKHWMNK